MNPDTAFVLTHLDAALFGGILGNRLGHLFSDRQQRRRSSIALRISGAIAQDRGRHRAGDVPGHAGGDGDWSETDPCASPSRTGRTTPSGSKDCRDSAPGTGVGAGVHRMRSGSAPDTPDGMGEILRTERLVIREWTDDDAAAALATYGSADVARWLHPAMDRVADENAMRARLREWAAQTREGEAGLGYWAVALADSDTVVGGVSLHLLPVEEQDVEIGLQLAPEHWGKGHASEAFGAVPSAWLQRSPSPGARVASRRGACVARSGCRGPRRPRRAGRGRGVLDGARRARPGRGRPDRRRRCHRRRRWHGKELFAEFVHGLPAEAGAGREEYLIPARIRAGAPDVDPAPRWRRRAALHQSPPTPGPGRRSPAALASGLPTAAPGTNNSSV